MTARYIELVVESGILVVRKYPGARAGVSRLLRRYYCCVRGSYNFTKFTVADRTTQSTPHVHHYGTTVLSDIRSQYYKVRTVALQS